MVENVKLEGFSTEMLALTVAGSVWTSVSSKMAARVKQRWLWPASNHL